MKVSFTYKYPEARVPIEKETERHVIKLTRLLKSYSPDLVQLHGSLGNNAHKGAFSLSLNLSLPTGTLHSTASGREFRAICKKAFVEIEAQVKKHQSRLRKDYEWKRKRERRRAETLS
jgi:ribosome-associated translation inhibitor RaiA